MTRFTSGAGRVAVSLVTALLLTATARQVFGEVVRFEIRSTRPVSGGRSFGSTGPYDEVTGRLYFAVNPLDRANRLVVDLDKAPRDASGRVEFSADVVIYRPRDAARGNAMTLLDVVNRGNKTIIGGFGRPGMATDREAGDGFLFARGFTVVCVGWEFDVPRREGAIRIDAPVATAVRGVVTAMFTPASGARDFSVGDLAAYAPTDPSAEENTLTVRDAPLSPAVAIPRSAWHLAGNTVTIETGFQPGRWYEVSYAAADPPVAGVGFLAIRDAAAWLKHGADLPASRHVIAFGSSQSGRFLRTFLYEGFKTDEKGRQAFDGVMAHIAGAARIDLNRRWAIPTSLGTYTATSFPFADVKQRDPVTGVEEGALDNPRARSNQPKVFYTNTAVEYWGGGRVAALVHTSADGSRDLELPANERVYFLTGSQHGPAAFPPSASNGQQKDNPTDYWWMMRALLVGMESWVREGTLPPDSRYPRLTDGTLVNVKDVTFPAIANVRSPRSLTAGGRVSNPLIAQEGAPGTPLPLLVPEVDRDGNERAGIRLPDVSVPLATVTGWNFRKTEIGAPDQLFPLLGSYIPFAVTKSAREAAGDPRQSIEERYRGREQYLQQVRDAANTLVKGRYLLAEDVPGVVRRAEDHWNALTGQLTTKASRDGR
jgi:hypothetical protein